jgi:tRNA isopentenyl-2-thiomethyl-A-37 hydroxylase MiaE
MDRFEQIKAQAEREAEWRELTELRRGSPSEVLEYWWKAEPWLRMTRIALQEMVQAEYAEGMRHRLRTKEAILAFLNAHGIPYEVIGKQTEG